MAFQVNINATTNIDALTPPGPNRAAAHSNSGTGAKMNAGMPPAALLGLNTRRLTTTIPTARVAASIYRVGLTLRNEEIPFSPKVTIVGTMTRLAIMLEVSRAAHNAQ